MLFCLIFTAAVSAQPRVVHKEVNTDNGVSFINDGQKLDVKISGSQNGRSYHFARVYNIKGMHKNQVDALKKHLLDSLGVK